MESWIGQQLGPYELQSKLGAGGMGVVYRATHRRLGQARAIKVLPAALAHDETFLQRFEREARLSSELRHPNIVMIFDIAEDQGVNYIVMELLDGRSLHEVIRKDGPLPIERSVVLLRQLAGALDFAHARGVVHRDIKPGNALVGDTDHLTLVDFGIARAAEGTRLTEASSRIGTAEYMAPESITDGDSGPGTDLYALGVIAYEMLTGRVPFTGVNSQTIMYAQIHTPPPSPRTFRTDLSPAVEAVVLRQLDKDPTRRFPTAQAFVAALEQARLGQPADERAAPTAAGSGYQPTALLDSPPDTGQPSGTVQPPAGGPRAATRPPAPGAAAPGIGASTPPRGTAAPRPGRASQAASIQTPRPGPPTGPGNGRAAASMGTGRAPVPPPPTGPISAADLPPPSGLQRVIDETQISTRTVYKLAFGIIVLALLLMTFLPTPRDPAESNASYRLAFPFGIAGGFILGADDSGRDVLSQMMVGGRFLVLRMVVIGAILTGICRIVRRRMRKRGGRIWPSTRGIVLVVAIGLAVAMLQELVVSFLVGGNVRSSGGLGPVGTVLLGIPRTPPGSSWGSIIALGRFDAVRAPWLILFPGGGLVLIAAACIALGSGIVDVLRLRADRRTLPAPTRVAGD